MRQPDTFERYASAHPYGKSVISVNSTPDAFERLQPGSITVNAVRNYTFAGTGSIVGNGTLTKQNSGTLIVANNNSSYSGTIDIQGGTVQVGSGSTSGSLGSGAITDNGAWSSIAATTLPSPTPSVAAEQ